MSGKAFLASPEEADFSAQDSTEPVEDWGPDGAFSSLRERHSVEVGVVTVAGDGGHISVSPACLFGWLTTSAASLPAVPVRSWGGAPTSYVMD